MRIFEVHKVIIVKSELHTAQNFAQRVKNVQ